MNRDQVIALIERRLAAKQGVVIGATAPSPIEQNAKATKHSNIGLFIVLGLCGGVLAIGKLKS